MAFFPYFVIGPTSFLSLIGFICGPDRTVPTPAEDWRDAVVDLLIPTYNEEKTIALCLSSIRKQSLKPRQIILIDDASKDKTIEITQQFMREYDMNIRIITRERNEGKTPGVYRMLCESDADVMALVDGDTVLKSKRYLQRLVEELYKGVGISSACGRVYSLTETERWRDYRKGHLKHFSQKYPDVHYSPDKTWSELIQRAITNAYRNELYLFLQNFIYYGEMTFFGTLIFPIGCAVVYRRAYLKNIFDKYIPIFGFDMTTSEDIFFGFAFAAEGYRNVAVSDVVALTTEPRFSKLYKQIYKWSSSYYQSCFYFNSLLTTPFKLMRNISKSIQDRADPNYAEILEKRKIKEAYRQAFGMALTEKYGRKIGWFIFTTLLEKTLFPTFLIAMILLRQGEILVITLIAEVLFYSIMIGALAMRHRLKNVFKAVLISPIRYSVVFFDLYVVGNFMVDLWVTKNRSWRK